MIITDQVAEILHGLGIRRVYGLPGEDHMALLDSFATAGLDYCAAFNESAAVIMAATEAQLTGLPGVAILSLAPGVSNGVNGLLNTYLDEVPLLLISGQHPADRLPFVVRQGFNIERLVAPCTKWQGRITAGMDVPSAVGKAVDEAMSGRPGPVYLEIPDGVATSAPAAGEAAGALATARLRARWTAPADAAAVAAPAAAAVDDLSARLAAARRPALLLGGRRRRVTPATVEAFSSAFRVPVFTSSRQKGVLDPAAPYCAGTFLNGRLEQRLLGDSDLVIMIDPEAFDFYNKPWSFGAPAVAITTAAFTEWMNPFAAQLVADAESVLRALAARGGGASQWQPADVTGYRRSVREALLPPQVTSFSVAQAVAAALAAWPPDGYLVADAGFSKPLVAMLSEPELPDHYLASNSLSTMGYAIPAAVAARRAGAANVLAFLGDGSLLMRGTELMVSAADGAPGVFVAIMDRALTQIEVKQERRRLKPVGVALPAVSCAGLAAAFGIEGTDVDNADDLMAAVAKGLQGDRPALVGAHVDPAPSRVLFDLLRGVSPVTTDGRPTVAVLDPMPPASRQVIADIFGGEFNLVQVDDDSPEAKRRAAADATVLLTMWGAVDAATIAAAPKARLIQKLGVGTDKIDTAAAGQRGIVVLKAAGVNADAVAELTVLLILAVGRNLGRAMAAATTGQVEKEVLRAESFQLPGKTVGLLGLGHIGLAVARRLAGFGVTLIYHDLRRASAETEAAIPIRYAAADEVITSSDVISLHLPSTPATDNLIGEDVLARVKPGLILVNTARGSLVDERALVKAIADGRVRGAGLDVTAQEPLPATSPLHGLDRVVLTPHVGGAVANNFPRVIRHAYDNVQAVLAGARAAEADIVTWPGRRDADGGAPR